MRKIAFWLSLIMIVVIPLGNIVDIGSIGTFARSVGLAVAAFWIAVVVITGKVRKPHLLHVVAIVFIVWNALSILWTVDIDYTFERLFTYVQLFILIYIIWDLYTKPETFRMGMQAYILGAYIAIVIIIFNFASGTTSTYHRYSAAGFSGGDLAIILTIGMPMAWHLAISGGGGFKESLLKLVNYSYPLFALFAIALTGARSAIFAVIPAIILILVSLNRLSVAVRVVIFIALLGALSVLQGMVPEESIQRLASTSSEISGGNLTGRVYIWEEGLAVFSEHPILGVGSGAFRSAVEVSVLSERKVAHNSFLSVLVEVGLPGFVLFATLLAIITHQIFRQPKWDSRLWLTVLLIWIIGASTLTFEHNKTTWLVIGLIIVSANLIQQPYEVEEYSPGSISYN